MVSLAKQALIQTESDPAALASLKLNGTREERAFKQDLLPIAQQWLPATPFATLIRRLFDDWGYGPQRSVAYG